MDEYDTMSDEFYEKFDGYAIPRRKRPAESGSSSASTLAPPMKKLDDSSNGYGSQKRGNSSPNKPKKVSRKSAKEFLKEDNEFNPGSHDPLGLNPTYGEFKGDQFSQSFIDIWQSHYEDELPDEIVSKCTQSICKICGIEFPNLISARTHYGGRAHTRKARIALEMWVEEDPSNRKMPVLKQEAQTVSGQAMPVTFFENRSEENEKYCEVCELALSSKIVATSHYQGKAHQKNLRKRTSGLYVSKDKESFPSFKSPSPKKPKLISDVLLSDKESRKGSGNRFFCLQCKLHFTSSDKYHAHLSSAAHKSGGSSTSEAFVENTTPEGDQNMFESQEASEDLAAKDSIDEMLSKIRANPRSAYDCTICNVECNTQDMLNIHLAGKKHLKKVAALASGNPVASFTANTGSTPVRFRCEVCCIEVTDQNGLDMHLKGKKHMKKIKSMV